jgi:hypothetical protein
VKLAEAKKGDVLFTAKHNFGGNYTVELIAYDGSSGKVVSKHFSKFRARRNEAAT